MFDVADRDDRVAVEERREERHRVGIVLRPGGEDRERDVLGGASRGSGYPPAAATTWKVIPIFFALAWTTGSSFRNAVVRVSSSRRTPWQAAALHVPSCAVSYWEPRIACFAFARLPRSPGRRVRVVLGELVGEHRVGDDVVRDLPEQGAAPGLAELRLVHDPVHRPPDVDVVEGRLGQVHGQVPRPVGGVEVEAGPPGGIPGVALERLRREAHGVLVLEVAGRDLVDDVGGVRVDGEPELVREALARGRRVGLRVVVGVPDEGRGS